MTDICDAHPELMRAASTSASRPGATARSAARSSWCCWPTSTRLARPERARLVDRHGPAHDGGQPRCQLLRRGGLHALPGGTTCARRSPPATAPPADRGRGQKLHRSRISIAPSHARGPVWAVEGMTTDTNRTSCRPRPPRAPRGPSTFPSTPRRSEEGLLPSVLVGGRPRAAARDRGPVRFALRGLCTESCPRPCRPSARAPVRPQR